MIKKINSRIEEIFLNNLNNNKDKIQINIFSSYWNKKLIIY